VARLAGLPPTVVVRAQEILRNLERTEFDREGRPRIAYSDLTTSAPERQLPLFTGADDAVLDDLRRLELDAMTPLEAMALLAEIQRRLKA
jgi:DNA mismatch repair protein MutS